MQTSDDTLEVRAVCQDDTTKHETLSGLAAQLQAYLVEQGCSDCHILGSDRPMIPNKRGGKTPLFCRI